MSTNSENSTSTTSKVLHRLVLPIQSRGNLGKSTETLARCEWMNQRSVSWKGYDLDAFNHTFSNTFPDRVAFVEQSREPEGDLIKIFRRLSENDVTVIDPRAHMNKVILRAMEMVQLSERCGSIGARITVLIYPTDDLSDMEDIVETVEILSNKVDWVVVRNPAKIPAANFFRGSELEAQLAGYGAAFLEIPALLSDTRNYLRSREVQLGRALSPTEALKVQFDIAHRIVLEQWLSDVFERYDAIARHLIPTAKVAALKSPPTMKPATRKRRTSGVNLENIA